MKRKRHPFGRSWRAELGRQAKPVTREEYLAQRAAMEAERLVRYLAIEAARAAKLAAKSGK